MMKFWAVLAVVFAGCGGDGPVETGLTMVPTVVIETAGTTTTTTETAETGATGTTTTKTPVADWRDLSVSPAALTVDVGAEVTYRTRATDPDNLRVEPDGVAWNSSDLAVVMVIDGVATAVGAGVATVTATLGDFVEIATLTVQNDGVLHVTVVDLHAGTPLEGVSVTIDGIGLIGSTDKSGMVVTKGISPSPVTIATYSTETMPTIAAEIVGRRVILGVRQKDEVIGNVKQSVSGSVDGQALDPGITEIGIVMVGSTFPQTPWSWNWHSTVSEMRDVSVFGIQVSLPENVLIVDVEENWKISRPSGDWGFWALGTVVPLTEALSAGNGDGDVFSLFSENLDSSIWGMVSGVSVDDGSVDAGQIPLNNTPDGVVHVRTKELPTGTVGTEQALVYTFGEISEGYLVNGMSTGLEYVDVIPAPGLQSVAAIGIVQEEFMGSGKGTSIAVGFGEDIVELGAWLGIPRLPSVYASTHEVRHNIDEQASIVMALVEDRSDNFRDFYGPPTNEKVPFPEYAPTFEFGNTTWDITLISHASYSYEELMATGPVTLAGIADGVVGVSMIEGEVSASAPD
jgi:plastocyanin